MSVEGGGGSVGRARRPVLMAVAVVAIVLVAATAYTVLGPLPSPSADQADPAPGAVSKVTFSAGDSGARR
jgi:hypothetical protein